MSFKLFRPFISGYQRLTQTKFNRGARAPWNAAAVALFGIMSGSKSSFFMGDAALATPSVSALTVTLQAGLGIQYNVSNDLWISDYQPIILDDDVIVQFESNSDPGGQERIDLVCVRAVDSSGDSQAVEFKDPNNGSITSQTVDNRVEDDWEILIVKGDLSFIPIAPSTPAGYVPVCTAVIQNGVSAFVSTDVADVRPSAQSLLRNLRARILTADKIVTQGQTLVAAAIFDKPSGAGATYDYEIESGYGFEEINYLGGAEKYVFFKFAQGFKPRSNRYMVTVQAAAQLGNDSTDCGYFVASPLDTTGFYAQYITQAGALAEPPSAPATAFHGVSVVDLTPLS